MALPGRRPQCGGGGCLLAADSPRGGAPAAGVAVPRQSRDRSALGLGRLRVVFSRLRLREQPFPETSRIRTGHGTAQLGIERPVLFAVYPACCAHWHRRHFQRVGQPATSGGRWQRLVIGSLGSALGGRCVTCLLSVPRPERVEEALRRASRDRSPTTLSPSRRRTWPPGGNPAHAGWLTMTRPRGSPRVLVHDW